MIMAPYCLEWDLCCLAYGLHVAQTNAATQQWPLFQVQNPLHAPSAHDVKSWSFVLPLAIGSLTKCSKWVAVGASSGAFASTAAAVLQNLQDQTPVAAEGQSIATVMYLLL